MSRRDRLYGGVPLCRTWPTGVASDMRRYRRMARGKYLRCGHLDDFLSEGLVVETVSEEVSKVSQGTLHAVGDSLLLALHEVSPIHSLSNEKKIPTLSNAAPLLFALSNIPYPTSS